MLVSPPYLSGLQASGQAMGWQAYGLDRKWVMTALSGSKKIIGLCMIFEFCVFYVLKVFILYQFFPGMEHGIISESSLAIYM